MAHHWFADLRHNTRALLHRGLAALPGERPRWVVLEIGGPYPARRPTGRIWGFEERAETLEQLTEKLQALAEAPWVEGVVLRIEGLRAPYGTVFALREAVQRLRDAGKQTLAYLTRVDFPSYYLASAAQTIAVPESAEFSLFGLKLSVTFVKDFLDRYGIRFEKQAIREYKSAGDNLVHSRMSEANREQYTALLERFFEVFTQAVAASRGVDPKTVRDWVDAGITSAKEAQARGLVDRVAYEDELIQKHHQPYRAAARFLPPKLRAFSARRVAVVPLVGAIVTGPSRRVPLPLPILGGDQAGSESLLRALRLAEADPRTAAIVLYVDSPGGSALASDLILREVARIKKTKPVVAVLGPVAASGGYYVACQATRIVAAPTTLTGSIGVVTLLGILEEFNHRYGLNPEAITLGRFAELGTSRRAPTEEERALIQQYIEEVYARFVARVTEGRGLEPTRVDEIGRGRVWAGQDALELGLVDELGDVERGLALARKLAGLPPDAPAWNVPMPKPLILPRPDQPSAFLKALAPLLAERALLLHPEVLEIR